MLKIKMTQKRGLQKFKVSKQRIFEKKGTTEEVFLRTIT